MNSVKVVLADSKSLEGEVYDIEEEFFKEKGIDFTVKDCMTEEDVIKHCSDADAVLSVYAPLTENVISQLPKCKVLVRYGIGFDNIDVSAATKHNIPVCNIPDYSIPEVATHTIAMLLHFERKIGVLDQSVKKGEWNPNLGFKSSRLSSLTLGLIGFGNIAQQTAEYAKAFGMNVIAYDPYISDNVLDLKGVMRTELDELIKESDYISVHVPLNEGTYHLIGESALQKMKETAVILNTARGPIVDQEALVKALKSNQIRGACLDVLENEPVKVGDEILELNNVVLTPHAAFNSVQASERLHRRVAETAYSVLQGELPENIVNKNMMTSSKD